MSAGILLSCRQSYLLALPLNLHNGLLAELFSAAAICRLFSLLSNSGCMCPAGSVGAGNGKALRKQHVSSTAPAQLVLPMAFSYLAHRPCTYLLAVRKGWGHMWVDLDFHL